MRKTRKEISKSEIRNVFRQIEKISSQRKPYFQVPQPQGIVEGWVTTGGSAKFDNTLISVSQRKSTLNSKKRTKPTPKKSRLGKGLLVGLVSATLTFLACGQLANAELPSAEILYQAPQIASSTAPQSAQKPLGRMETLNPVSESIKEKIARYSAKYDVDPKEIYATIDCETGHTFDPKIRSRYLEGTPRHERSWGLAQIWLTGHPDVTYEQAIDPDFAIEFMTKNWKQHKDWWMCAKILNI